METYRFVGETEQSFDTLGRVLKPGDTFESDVEINHGHVVRVEIAKPGKKEEKA